MNEDRFDIVFFEEHYKNGSCRIKSDSSTIVMNEFDDCYTVQVNPSFPRMDCEYKIYDAETFALKLTGTMLKHGNAKIGVWRSFDQFGAVSGETDFEKGWNIHWEQLLKLLSAEGIQLNAVVSIKREDFLWKVGVIVSEDMMVNYIFDGLTGERQPITFTELNQ